jgi:hypothetical protein
MGAEVTWRDIKKSCDPLGTLGAFIGTLCRYIETAMGEENMKRLRSDSGVPTAFVRAPRPSKEMWDQVQSVHRLTLSCCIILESPRQHAQHAYIDLMADVMECGADPTPLHLKIAIYHHKRMEAGDAMPLKLSDMKEVLMPRLRLLTQLDPDGLYEFNAPQMRELIRPHADEYQRVVLRDQLPEGMDVKGALKVYRNFKLLRAAPSWGDYPMSCTCKTNFGHCVCGDTLLFVSLFDHKVQVPKGYVGATVSERKQCKKIGGLAGRRRRRALEERQDDEKEIHSRAGLLAETPTPAAEAGPSPRGKALIVPEALLPTEDEDSDEDDFQVTFGYGLWCHCTDASRGWYRSSQPGPSEHGRGGEDDSIRGPTRPRRVSLPPELHRNRCRHPHGRLLSRLRAAQRRNRYVQVYNDLAELAENDLFSPAPAQENKSTEGRRTSGRASGAGRRKD